MGLFSKTLDLAQTVKTRSQVGKKKKKKEDITNNCSKNHVNRLA